MKNNFLILFFAIGFLFMLSECTPSIASLPNQSVSNFVNIIELTKRSPFYLKSTKNIVYQNDASIGGLDFGQITDAVTSTTIKVQGVGLFYTRRDYSQITNVISAELRLVSAYTPYIPANILFDVYTVKPPFDQATVRTYSPIILGNKLNTSPYIISTADTSKTSYRTYPLPLTYAQQLVTELQKGNDTYIGANSVAGLTFVPTINSSVITLDTSKTRLALTYDETTKTGTERKTVLLNLYYANYVVSQSKNFAADTTTGMYVSASIDNDAMISLSGLEKVPLGAHINYALLQVDRDTNYSKPFTQKQDRFIAHFNTSADPNTLNIDTRFIQYSWQDTIPTTSRLLTHRYKFNVTAMVQKWVNNPDKNFGIRVHPIYSYGNFTHARFYYKNPPNDTLRPKIYIQYEVAK